MKKCKAAEKKDYIIVRDEDWNSLKHITNATFNDLQSELKDLIDWYEDDEDSMYLYKIYEVKELDIEIEFEKTISLYIN